MTPGISGLAINPQSLDGLRMLAKQENDPEAIRAGAQQFEAYFLQMMLRSMRDTLPEDGLLDSQETRTFTDMLDQQFAMGIARSKGMGLADIMIKQLTRINAPAAVPAAPHAGSQTAPVETVPLETAPEALPAPPAPDALASARGFAERVWPHAASAGSALGVAPHLLLGQAALESGWGRRELRMPDGGRSHNLFNIKAGASWKGSVVQAETTEYVNGAAQKRIEKFRAYDSDQEAFADYAQLLATSPRYAGVVARGGDSRGFARGLQDGGFATDPGYADKLHRLLDSASFRTALRPEQDSSVQG